MLSFCTVFLKKGILTFYTGLGLKDLTAVILVLLHLALLMIIDEKMMLICSSLV